MRPNLNRGIGAVLTIGLLLIWSLVVASDDSEHENELPSLWTAILPSKSYHVIYQLEIASLPEVLTVEEWASFDNQSFRLDLIAGTSRTSYLTLGATGENYRYRPFECESLSEDAQGLELFKRFFIGYPINKLSTSDLADTATYANEGKPVVVYGLGPIWLRARAYSHQVKLIPPSEAANQEYHEYLVELKNLDNLRIKFFFPASGSKFLDTVEWDIEGFGTEGRAKVWQPDWQGHFDHSVFKLPVAYGCQRRGAEDMLKLDTGKVPLHSGYPNQVNLDIVTGTANDKLARSWTSRHVSMSLVRLSGVQVNDSMENHYAIESQERSTETGQMQTWRQIWWQPRDKTILALVYTIDQASGECQISHQDSGQMLQLNFPASSEQVVGFSISMSVEQLSQLLDDKTGYHLIDEGESFASDRFRNRLYEKRLPNFTLGGSESKPLWVGPVSLVKQISLHPDLLDEKLGPQTIAFKSSDHRITLFMFFYSPDSGKLLHKASLSLLAKHRVDHEYVQRRLDVSQCFAKEKRHDVVVKYPIESPRLAELLARDKRKIHERVYVALCLSVNSFLSPLQVAKMELSFDGFQLRVDLSLIDLPLTHTFGMRKGFKLKEPGVSSALLEVVAASADRCSEQCEHNQCLRFTYDSNARLCTIELVEGAANEEADPCCDLFEFINLSKKLMLGYDLLRARSSRSAILEVFQYYMDNQNKHLPGALDIIVSDLSSEFKQTILLVPSAIDLSIDESMNEFERDDSADEVRLESGSVNVEYRRVAQDRKFDRVADFGRSEIKVANYEQCARLCSASDCRSFSYCAQTESCQLSDAHQEAVLKLHTVETKLDEHCNLFALDYLSKFEAYGCVPMPDKSAHPQVAGPIRTAHDCANACMDETSFSCQGFYYCNIKTHFTEIASCYMHDTHIVDHRSSDVGARFSIVHSSSDEQCDFYSRSYLAHFDKYLGRKLQISKGTWSQLYMIDSDSCAKHCIKNGCLAFSLSPNDGISQLSGKSQLVCTLLYNWVKRDQLVRDQKSTTFILSDRSQFSRQKIKLVDGSEKNLAPTEPDSKASPGRAANSTREVDERDVSSETIKLIYGPNDDETDFGTADKRATSPIVARLISLTAGAFLGTCLILLWDKAYAHGYLDRFGARHN